LIQRTPRSFATTLVRTFVAWATPLTLSHFINAACYVWRTGWVSTAVVLE